MDAHTLQSQLQKSRSDVASRFGRLLSAPVDGRLKNSSGLACAVLVSGGVHKGALLKVDRLLRVGSAVDNDIVLRDPGVMASHAELRRVDGLWGFFDSETGKQLSIISQSIRGRLHRRSYGIGSAEVVVSQLKSSVVTRKKIQSQLKLGVAPALFFAAVLLGAAVIYQLSAQPAKSHLNTSRNLAEFGFPDVNIVSAVDGQTSVTGYVADPAFFTRLRKWVEKSELVRPTVQVRVGSELVVRVKEAIADPRLTVDYQPGGVVRVQGQSDDLQLRERLSRLSSDLSGVVRLDNRVIFSEAVDNSPREYTLPIKIMDVRPGANGSFSGGNGARYFVGATLPDGAEVTGINIESIDFRVGNRQLIYHIK